MTASADMTLADGEHRHLPDCEEFRHDWGGGCICPYLRVCEQRVRNEAEGPRWLCTACWHREDGHTCERIERCMCRDCNYAAGVQAARDAVAAMTAVDSFLIGDDILIRCDALAAIDALRGES